MKRLEIFGSELLLWRKKLLLKGGRQEDLDWLLDIGGGLRWAKLQQIYLDPSRSFMLEQPLGYLETLWYRHLEETIPLQYLVGRCPWRDFELKVSPDALIPRQETEILMDLALDRVEPGFKGLWADLGTGSGAIAIALAKSFPDSKGLAVDCSEGALALAKSNLKLLAPTANVGFYLGSWWEPLSPWWGKISLVLANPPYIPKAIFDDLDPIVRKNEPRLALFGGEDGLNAVREVVIGSSKAICKGGWLMIEHHHDQSQYVLELMRKEGLNDVGFETDLQGIRRFALGRNY